MNRMRDKVCVVTGAARGIGRGIAELFAAEGARHVWVLDMNADELEAMERRNEVFRGAAVNVSKASEVSAFVEKALSESGGIDVLVNNAGITRDALIHKMTEEDWDAVLSVNLKGVFLMTKFIAPAMMERGSGSIVSIASVVGLDGNIGQSNYAAAKGGIVSMTKSWAKEFARKGAKVRVNSVSPGYTRTPMIETVPEKVLEPIIAKTPLGRLADIGDIANAVLFLSGEESAFITGQVLRVDGGLVL